MFGDRLNPEDVSQFSEAMPSGTQEEILGVVAGGAEPRRSRGGAEPATTPLVPSAGRPPLSGHEPRCSPIWATPGNGLVCS
jgi:hypothetical protein